ncbi:hypothetical protein BGZ91_004081 [Linnemannia elongata]|nr:hypothetical protein BGZ91_004081 [Linnemannia elongata]KAG0081210.1 hypothetical protein BGZ90_009733 [Linnemannia elongata]
MCTTNAQQTTIAALPTEILDIILSELERPHIASCVLVNQAWFNVFSPYLWRSIHYIEPKPVPVQFLGELKLESRFYLRLKNCIEAGALVRNGHWIHKVDLYHYGIAVLLATYGVTCTNLLDLNIHFSVDAAMIRLDNGRDGGDGGSKTLVDLSPLITILLRNPRLRSLSLDKGMLNEDNPDFEVLLDSLPASIESISFESWDPLYSGRKIFVDEEEDSPDSDREEKDTINHVDNENINDYKTSMAIKAPPTTKGHLPNLKRLSFKHFALDHQEQTLRWLLPRCVNLETILLEANYVVMPLTLFSSLLQQHCPKLRNLFIKPEWLALSGKGLVDILSASKAGWKSLGLPQQLYDAHLFGPPSIAELLRHAGTLENLRLDGSSRLPSFAIQQLLSSAPNLRRLDAIRKDRSLDPDFELDANDVASGKPWVCSKLESLKVRIIGVPRPDLTRRSNGRPLEGPLHQGTMEESRRIQLGVYQQLGRLTNLKQLVLGHDDVDVTRGCLHDERMSEGEYYREGDAIQKGHQYECLEMTVESGIDAMAEMRELRVLELEAMEVGELDRRWTEKNWPQLGSACKDTFWTDLGYKEYS